MKQDPLLTVCVQTYQHAPYIAECLDSILAQDTNFSFEIVVGEDSSTDGTREICQKYALRYPEKIRLFLRSRDNVIYLNNRPTGRYNFVQNLKSAKGQYIAMCEGDDYWIDKKKLQKQIDFLETHSEYIMCFHNAKVVDFKSGQLLRYVLPLETPEKNFYTEDLFGRPFIPTASVVFKHLEHFQLPEWTMKVPSLDMALYTLLSEFGKIKYLNEPMSVYRKHHGGISLTHQGIFQLRSRILLFELLNHHFENKYVLQEEAAINTLIVKYIMSPKNKFWKQIFNYYKEVAKQKIRRLF